METITIKVDETEYTAIVPNGDGEIIVNGEPLNINILKKISGNVYSVSVDNRVYILDLQNNDSDFIQIYSDGFMFDVEITDEKKRIIKQYLKDTGASDDTGYAMIKAPMPGMLIKVLANVGAQVNKGDKILIIEAMKMENAVASPISGIVKTVNAVEGKSVEKNQLLIEIESNK